jgi:hypothetical protein
VSQKEVKLYDDSVIKLTIKQGTENERFPNLSSDKLLSYDDINSVSGALVSGELGWTRDTNRLFVGNISDELKTTNQQTLGGVLTGNKYLGFIDSRSTTKKEAKPIDLRTMLTDTSYRTYNFGNDVKSNTKTVDHKWSKLPYYNATYDAYDGDYMYDTYRNALILFDHNLVSSNNPAAGFTKMNGKRKTRFEPRFDGKTEENLEGGEKTVNSHTKDMYGDGYVLFYNVIPDGDTLTFADKSFNENGIDTSEADANTNNYSYNIIKLNKVPIALVKDTLDENYFDTGKGGKIQLKKIPVGLLPDIFDSTYFTIGSNNKVQLKSDISTKLNALINNKFSEPSSNQLVMIYKDENSGEISLKNSNTKVEDLATQNYVDNKIKAALTGANVDIDVRVEVPVPNFAGSKELSKTEITASELMSLLGYDDKNEAQETNHFLLIGGTGEMKVTHYYKSSVDTDIENPDSTSSKTETINDSTTFGSADNTSYFEILLPFRLNMEDEKLTISGDGISRKVIIPEK